MHLLHHSAGDSMDPPTTNEKCNMVEELLHSLLDQKRLNEYEVSVITDILEEQAKVIEVLKEENFQIREKYPKMQPLQEEMLNYRNEASETIQALAERLGDMSLKVLELEKKVTQFGIDLVYLETSKVKDVTDTSCLWQEKLKESYDQSKKITEEIVKRHCESKKSYECAIHNLKEQIAHKEAEVAWCQLMIKERNLNIDKEMGNLKRELEVSTLKNQELLQQRLAEVERRANKMTRKCLKLQQDYEQKISNLKKEKDLQVQALQKYVLNEAERETFAKESQMEDAVRELELRYRKIIISLHTAAKEQREKDLKKITLLESAMKFVPLEKNST